MIEIELCEDPDAHEINPSKEGRRKYYAFGQIWDSISGYWLSTKTNPICKTRRQLGEYTWLKFGRTIPVDEKGRPYELHHKDGNKRNNLLENLEYISIKDHHKVTKKRGKIRVRRISTNEIFPSIKAAIDHLNENCEKSKKPGRYIIQSNLAGDYINPDWERLDDA